MLELTLDHVVIAVRDLEAASADYAALLGREPSWKGEHPTYGTRNTLFRIDNTYVELLALGGDGKDGRWAGELSRFLERGEGLYALALGTTDVDRAAEILRDRGLHVQDPASGDGIDQITGTRREWRNAMIPLKSTRGTRVFVIEHRSSPDALPPAAPNGSDGAYVTRLDHVVMLSPDLEASRRLWADGLGLRLALDRTFPERDSRILFFRAGDITIEISGGAQQTEEGVGKPDRMWGVAWGVKDLAATVARLRAAGIEVSEPRRGVKPGTLVATAKGVHTHGVATLLIEHTPESFRPESRMPQGVAIDNTPQQRAFTALRLDHVAVAVTDTDEATKAWQETLGLAPSGAADTGAHAKLTRLPAGNGLIVLAQALSNEHGVARWIADRGPGMYAMAIEVDNVDSAVRDLRAKGVDASEPEYGAWPGTRIARISPGSANGVSIQLVQRLPEVL